MHTRNEIIGAAKMYGSDDTFNRKPPFDLGENAMIAPMLYGYRVGATIYVSKTDVDKYSKQEASSVPLDLLVSCKTFLNDLKTLLGKYDAKIVAEDHWTGYAECGQDVRMTVEFENFEMEDLDLGRYVDKEKHGGV